MSVPPTPPIPPIPPTPPRADAPLLAGAVHGVRAWAIGSHGLLQGAGNGAKMPWLPEGEPTSAHCLAESHPAPDPGCGCGLYAYHPHAFAVRRMARTRRGTVTGVVEAWGRVELHAGGFRAKYARPLALFVSPLHLVGFEGRQQVEVLAARYRAQLVELPEPAMAAGWCARRGLGLDQDVVADLLGLPVAERARSAAEGSGCE